MSAKNTCAIAGAIVLAAFACPVSAAPRHPQARAWCVNKDKALLDQQIRGCTMLIQSSRKKKNIGRVFYTRGIAYYRNGQYGDAIADYDEAIRFGYTNALYNRSLAKEKQGDEAGAAADIEAFKNAK
jgi:tetratricopeptide (TPR) repeat protein